MSLVGSGRWRREGLGQIWSCAIAVEDIAAALTYKAIKQGVVDRSADRGPGGTIAAPSSKPSRIALAMTS